MNARSREVPSAEPIRTVAVHCPDWPAAAAGAPPDEPAAVFHANRVVAATAAARRDDVVPGLRRREAQRRCPELVVHTHDPARDARAFEAVAAALGTLTPRVEVTRPGTCSFASRGPSRYHGGDAPLLERAEAVARGAVAGRAPVRVGLADGPFAALLAAVGASDHQPTALVPPGGSPAFLAPLPVTVLGEWAAGVGGGGGAEVRDGAIVELVGVLGRLGLHTLGAFAALPAGQVAGRFGPAGSAAHRLASGLDPRPLSTRPIPPELTVAAELDPPAERVDRVAFAAKALADELLGRLHHDGLACARLLVVAETEHSERLERCWQTDTGFGQMGAAAVADRVRWQLDGWLSGPPAVRPTSGIIRLALVPEELVVAGSRQPGFWGGAAGAGERVVRAVARVSGLLGPEAVCVPELGGGRDPERQVRLVPAVAVELREQRRATTPSHALPWPGRMPPPTPAAAAATAQREAIEVCDVTGREVAVDGRGQLSAPPAEVWRGRRSQPVTAWAGPWPTDERWWDPEHHRRRARLQVVTPTGAYLVAREHGSWWLEALYA
ncbi:MAG TPA: hypothetical protein VHA73_06745 [Acidimicrobiales bacterium]|nr:hypothetical protein [Acidimicrobiales bacterium]